MATTDRTAFTSGNSPTGHHPWSVRTDDPDIASASRPDDEPMRRARISGDALADFSRRSYAWTCMYRASDDGDLATDPAFHARRLAVFMNHRAHIPHLDPPPGADRLGYFVGTMREAQGLSRIDLANNHDRAAIDPVAIMMLEHGRLSTRELGTVFLSRVAIALGTSLSTLEALRDDYAVEAASTKIAGQRVSIAHAVSGWLRSAYSAILPQSPEMAVALGDGGASTIHADTGVHSQGNRTIDRPVPLAVTTLVDHLGRSFQAVPTLKPESHPLPGVCGVEVALTDDTNTPVSGRRIRLIVLGNPILRDVEPTATTDERGIAQFARISLAGILAGYELAESEANASPFTIVPDA